MGHIKDGAYDFTQGKTDKPMWITLTDRLKSHLAGIEKKGLMVVTDAAGRLVRYRRIAEEMRKVKAQMEHPEASKYVTRS